MVNVFVLFLCLLSFAQGLLKCVNCSSSENATDDGIFIIGGEKFKVRLLHVLFRHGARTPINWLPNDPHNSLWSIGPGQLTNVGKLNQWRLGSFLRQRYSHFLHQSYHINYTVVRSTDVDRTLMSAAVNLAALYPPRDKQVWNTALLWQPVPVHTLPCSQDLLLRFQDSCPRFVVAQSNVLHSERVRLLNKHYEPLFRYLSENSGVSVTNIEQASSIYDTLSIEHSLNLSLPIWSSTRIPDLNNQTVFPHLLNAVSDLSFQMVGWSSQVRRLGGGQLVSEIVRHMVEFSGERLLPLHRQLFMYSAHDFNVAAFLSSLGAFNNIKPPLASCVIVELLQTVSAGTSVSSLNSFLVRVVYRNSSDQPPHELVVPGCGRTLCPLPTFIRVTRAVRPADARAECGLDDTGGGMPSVPLPAGTRWTADSRTFFYLSGACLLAFTAAVCVVVCKQFRRPQSSSGKMAYNSSDYRYTSLQHYALCADE